MAVLVLGYGREDTVELATMLGISSVLTMGQFTEGLPMDMLRNGQNVAADIHTVAYGWRIPEGTRTIVSAKALRYGQPALILQATERAARAMR